MNRLNRRLKTKTRKSSGMCEKILIKKQITMMTPAIVAGIM